MKARQSIFHHIQEALKHRTAAPPAPAAGEIFQPIPENELLSRFEREVVTLNGEFHSAKSWESAQQWVETIVQKNKFGRVAIMPHVDTQTATRTVKPEALTGAGDCAHKLAGVDLGVTICDALIAATGSVVITSETGFGRALSILPPAHLVVARRSQLVAYPSDALKVLRTRYGGSATTWPSMMTIITGPSRTADIEKILVLGAHGPKQLFVLLLDF
jgi:L-lactate dehydrogenase complex protein LldG